jgi:hypothetical protein
MSILPLFAEALRTRNQFGIGLVRQSWQSIALRSGRCRLDFWEYFFFQVYLDRYPLSEKKRFAGWRRELAFDKAANSGPERALANDKLLFHAHMAEHDAPQPKLRAVLCGHDPAVPGAVHLHDANDAEAYLRDPAHLPLFIKPIHGAHGRNAFSVRSTTPDQKNLVLASGTSVGLADFVTGLTTRERGGWLFQERLKTDDRIGLFSGDRLTSLRVIVVFTSEGPELISGVWKIPTGKNVTDNFSVGRSGNLIAGIDMDTGRVLRMVQGVGWKNRVVTHHPDTGADLDKAGFTDRRLPGWKEAKALCLKYADLFPGLHLQHWDIALTDRGPLILEINVEGGMRTHQIVQQRGIVGPELTKFGV